MVSTHLGRQLISPFIMKKVPKNYFLHTALWVCLLCISSFMAVQAQSNEKIDLSGEWAFAIDPQDEGVQGKWFSKKLEDNIQLPGSMTSNGKGYDITLETPWTGSIFDSAYFKNTEYAKYRKPGNIKVPFWLQPVKYYKGPAWYQKTVTIPNTWKGKGIELFIERSHWETTVWVDNKPIGMENSLGTPHVFDLTETLTPGTHQLTIRIDNRVKEIEVGQNSHSVSDHTQSNWNGMVGQLLLTTRPVIFIQEVQVYPDLQTKQVTAKLTIRRPAGKPEKASIELIATSTSLQAEKLTPLRKEVTLTGDSITLQIVYPMGAAPLLWDEFKPNLYSLHVRLTTGKGVAEEKKISFGMREFATKGTQFTMNGRPAFLRGTLECAIFPKTGYPPTDVASWTRIFEVCKSYGLNHMRFHSWCPPEAAFEAADQAGFYLQLESSSWANQGVTIGDGSPLDRYIYAESERMVKSYGNHPSFCMLTYGNEPAGKNHVTYLTNYVKYWQEKDPRRLYTTAAGWPVIPESDYNSTPDPRIQAWGAGLKSLINSQPPRSNYDWSDTIAKWQRPTVSHEIGQWCVYPDFKEIAKYDGVLKAKNFEIFQERLRDHGMASLADSFLLASGKLQALCYKADIEAALRTPGFGGFQLLDLHDFPGQGTALVGVLNPFWEDKGYITGKEYSRFCNTTVPLARLPKMVYLNNEELRVPVEVAHFGETEMKEVTPTWTLSDASGKTVFNGQLARTNIALGNAIKLGEIRQSLSSINQPGKLVLTMGIGNYQNTWDIFVYPSSLPTSKDDILVTQQLDDKALQALRRGGNVLLTLKKGSIKPDKGGDVKIGFSSIFWNTAWTNGQAPTTLGILCNPNHPALQAFPTEYHSNWQWWDAMSHSNAIRLDAIAPDLKPIVRVIDDWVTAQPLGLLFECRVGKGRLLVSGIDLLENQDKRPEARQLLHSLRRYMASNAFQPVIQAEAEKIKGLMN
jgi:hypothetical protein